MAKSFTLLLLVMTLLASGQNPFIFSNPAGDKVTVELPCPWMTGPDISVWDLCGKKVYQLKDRSLPLEIDLSILQKGICLLLVSNGDRMYRQKLVKQ